MSPEQFKSARAALRLTQAQLATVLDLGAPTRVSEYERGIHAPNPQVCLLIKLFLAGVRTDNWPKT